MRRAVVVAVIATVLAVTVGVAVLWRSAGSPFAGATGVPVGCIAAASGEEFGLDLDQAGNAATIAAVGQRLGMPDHAVTVALAAALQESRLHNLDYGDRDSLGLFQQRPSQGWGTAAQLQDPVYAATAFYRELRNVSGWESLAVTVAAQKVQRSAYPAAYAQWEDEARIMARALTGQVPVGIRCAFPATPGGSVAQVERAASRELGPHALGGTVSAAQGWSAATWLVAHASDLHVDSVTFTGRTWTVASGVWAPGGPAASRVTYRLTTASGPA